MSNFLYEICKLIEDLFINNVVLSPWNLNSFNRNIYDKENGVVSIWTVQRGWGEKKSDRPDENEKEDPLYKSAVHFPRSGDNHGWDSFTSSSSRREKNQGGLLASYMK